MALFKTKKLKKQTEFKQAYLSYVKQQKAKKGNPQDTYTWGEWKRLKQATGSRQFVKGLKGLSVRDYREVYRKFLK